MTARSSLGGLPLEPRGLLSQAAREFTDEKVEDVVVNYRDHWFWIEDEDMRSKRAFAFIMMLFTLTESSEKQGLPVLTIPTQ